MMTTLRELALTTDTLILLVVLRPPRPFPRPLVAAFAAVMLASTENTPSPSAAPAPALEGEKFEYQAEVSRLMDIIINSL